MKTDKLYALSLITALFVFGSSGRIQGLPGFWDMVHHDHPGIAVRFVAISAQVTDAIPFLHIHAADEKTAHLTKSDGPLEKRIGCAHCGPLSWKG